MGQVYSVVLKLNFTDEEGAKKALQSKINNGPKEKVNYSLPHFAQLSATTETIEGLLKIIFSGWDAKLIKKGNSYSSDFNACYFWNQVMTDAFEDIAPFLSDGSELFIQPDNDSYKGTVKNGSVTWI